MFILIKTIRIVDLPIFNKMEKYFNERKYDGWLSTTTVRSTAKTIQSDQEVKLNGRQAELKEVMN